MKQLGLKAFVIATSMFFGTVGNAQNPIGTQTQLGEPLNESLTQTKTVDKDKPAALTPRFP